MKSLRISSVAFGVSLMAACSQDAGTSSANPPAPAVAAPAPVPAMAMTRGKPVDGTKVYFVGIKDGDTVTSPFHVGFGVDGMKVAPAGTLEPGSGHHHLIIDADLPPQDAPLPANDHVKHFGKGQTETDLTLPAGSHTLQLEFADGAHLPFDPPAVSDKITVTVK